MWRRTVQCGWTIDTKLWKYIKMDQRDIKAKQGSKRDAAEDIEALPDLVAAIEREVD